MHGNRGHTEEVGCSGLVEVRASDDDFKCVGSQDIGGIRCAVCGKEDEAGIDQCASARKKPDAGFNLNVGHERILALRHRFASDDLGLKIAPRVRIRGEGGEDGTSTETGNDQDRHRGLEPPSRRLPTTDRLAQEAAPFMIILPTRSCAPAASLCATIANGLDDIRAEKSKHAPFDALGEEIDEGSLRTQPWALSRAASQVACAYFVTKRADFT